MYALRNIRCTEWLREVIADNYEFFPVKCSIRYLSLQCGNNRTSCFVSYVGSTLSWCAAVNMFLKLKDFDNFVAVHNSREVCGWCLGTDTRLKRVRTSNQFLLRCSV
jgi:hypothetical protein